LKLIVAMTGASGALYGIRLLEALRAYGVETHLIVSRWGRTTLEHETKYCYQEVASLAYRSYNYEDMFCPAASGSARFDGMIVVPCSMKTLSGIRYGYADNLITRSADVTIKEGRRLILVVRETPLSPIQLENMLDLSRLGVVIMPPVPSFYTKPETLEDVIDQTVTRMLDQLGIDSQGVKRWGDEF